ncbi:carboxylesterase family protein [Corynebacterium sp. P6129]|uniref:carboxylesterase family protein n=1 Tax=Corynebacterium antarcticum TaxID=2800405 RepID=UPI002260BA47|nr:carboxylesterase family protein [Corynebacterium antarcticum]MCX7493011.1 carboxylesterase family protein [Corynebacterium antarcticum]
MDSSPTLQIQTPDAVATGVIVSPSGTGRQRGRDTVTFYSLPYSQLPSAFDSPEPLRERVTVDATVPKARKVGLTVSAPVSAVRAAADGASPPPDLPVIAFLHGGRYESGHHDGSWYGGQAFARDGAVFVSIGYRMAFEGFAHFDDEDPSHYRGTDDAVMALEWIQRNIESFGGDPTNVTLMGQSAGGGMAVWLARRDHYRGAFRRIVALSPGYPRQSFDRRRRALPFLGGSAAREKLTSLSPKRRDALYRRYRARYITDSAVGPSPFDGSQLVDVPILLTHTADEFYLEPVGAWCDARGMGAKFARLLAGNLGATMDPGAYIGACRRIDPDRVAGRMIGDSTIRRWVSSIAETAPGPVWILQFTGDGEQRALHCAELPLVFDCLDTLPARVDALLGDDAAGRLQPVADRVHRMVLDFASGQRPGWREFDADGDRFSRTLDITTGATASAADPLGYVRRAFP